jgi:hypothetical protein
MKIEEVLSGEEQRWQSCNTTVVGETRTGRKFD